MQFTAGQIAALVSGTVVGDAATPVSGVAKIEEARSGELTFLANAKYESYLADTKAGVVLITESLLKSPNPDKTYITVPDGYAAMARLLAAYEQMQAGNRKSGAEPMSFVSPSARVDASAWIAAFSYVSEEAQIAAEVQIYPGCFVGKGVQIGKGTVIHAGVKIYHGCILGEDCIIHAGAVIGSDGFGFAPQADGSYEKIPQTGIVSIGDRVEIGANTTLDRATMGATRIEDGAKLDNLIQIAHNVELGTNTVIAAQAGISGSTKIGASCMIGGQAGIVGHIRIADGTRINAQSGIVKSITEKGLALNGSPAFDYTASMKSAAVYRNLPDLQKKLFQLEKRIEALLGTSETPSGK